MKDEVTRKVPVITIPVIDGMPQFVELPDLSGMTPAELVDQLQVARKCMKYFQKVEGYVKQSLTACFEELEAEGEGEEEPINGRYWVATRKLQGTTRLDVEMIRQDMPAEWVKDHSTYTEFHVIKFTKRPEDTS